MAKLTKEVLKGIVKECLVEILSEGLMGKEASGPRRTQKTQKKRAPSKRSHPTNPGFDKKVQQTTRALTQDPMMAAIFEDTARTTLQEQIQNEASPIAHRHDLTSGEGEGAGAPVDSLFEGSSNWAALAFTEKKNV